MSRWMTACCPPTADQIEDRWLDEDDRGGVDRKQGGQVLSIEMVWMLMRHEHRVKIS
jgi:hypothetical protein